jgi:hypothetical protein
MLEGIGSAKWTDALDICLLRETKLQKQQSKPYGDRGAAYAVIEESLNACGRLQWESDNIPLARAPTALNSGATSAPARASARATGIEEQGELEDVPDDFIMESHEITARGRPRGGIKSTLTISSRRRATSARYRYSEANRPSRGGCQARGLDIGR